MCLESQKGSPSYNDLVLRDRSYFTSGEIERHRKAGADCIYRHKCKTICLDPVSGQPMYVFIGLCFVEQEENVWFFAKDPGYIHVIWIFCKTKTW
jgi:hypothetical protein